MLFDFGLLLRGIALGFAVAAPVGPIGLLCVRRTLHHGPAMGLATGLGAAIADSVYGAIAAFSVSALISFLTGYETQFRLFGGLFMLVVAYRAFQAPLATPAKSRDTASWFGGFATGIMLTFTNPITIFAFFALFAGFGLGGELGRFDALTLVGGVFLGSLGWWLVLNGTVSMMRGRISERVFRHINHGAAVALAGFGAYAVLSAVFHVARHAAGFTIPHL